MKDTNTKGLDELENKIRGQVLIAALSYFDVLKGAIKNDEPESPQQAAQVVEQATQQIMKITEALIEKQTRLARIEGINEAHKEIMEMAYAYTGEDELADFCGVDDLSRVAMSWKVNRIAELNTGDTE